MDSTTRIQTSLPGDDRYTSALSGTVMDYLNGAAGAGTNLQTLATQGAGKAPLWVSTPIVARVTLTGTASTSGGAIASWTSGAGAPIVDRVVIVTTTKSTGAANISVGVAANSTTSSSNLIDTLDVGTATVATDNINGAGASGKAVQYMSAPSSYVTVTGSASTAGLVGTMYITYYPS